MVLPQLAVGIVVNGVLRTLWVGLWVLRLAWGFAFYVGICALLLAWVFALRAVF